MIVKSTALAGDTFATPANSAHELAHRMRDQQDVGEKNCPVHAGPRTGCCVTSAASRGVWQKQMSPSPLRAARYSGR